MKMKERIDRIVARTPEHIKRYVRLSMDISDQIHAILEARGKTQKDLAKALGKTESEVSKWLSGQHNLTLRSIAKIEAALGEAIVLTPMRYAKHPGGSPGPKQPGYRRDVAFTPAGGVTIPIGKEGPESASVEGATGFHLEKKGRIVRIA